MRYDRSICICASILLLIVLGSFYLDDVVSQSSVIFQRPQTLQLHINEVPTTRLKWPAKSPTHFGQLVPKQPRKKRYNRREGSGEFLVSTCKEASLIHGGIPGRRAAAVLVFSFPEFTLHMFCAIFAW